MGIAHIVWLHAFAISSAIRLARRPQQSATPTHMSMGHAFHSKFFLLFLCLTKPDSSDVVRMFDPRGSTLRKVGGWVDGRTVMWAAVGFGLNSSQHSFVMASRPMSFGA